MKAPQFAKLNQASDDHLNVDVGGVMPQINEAESLWPKLARTVIADAPVINYRRVEGGFVKLVFNEKPPVVRQRLVNPAHTFEVSFQCLTKMLLAGKIPAVADPNRMRRRAQRPAKV